MKLSNMRVGFTLAEVLITLGIIGVVAAMTMPTLMSSTGDVQYKSGLKKSISTLSQGVRIASAQGRDFSNMGGQTLLNFLQNDMGLDIVASNTNLTALGYAANSYTLNNASTANSNNTAVLLRDGSVFIFPTGGTTNSYSTFANGAKCLIDVNGPKGPNKSFSARQAGSNPIGDIFAVRLYNSSIVPNSPNARFIMYHDN